jgi:hypothetical protein
MNDDIKKYPVYALSQQGLIPIEITSVNDYNHQTHQLHHYIRQGAYNGNKEWYDKHGIEQKLILMPNYVHLIVHNSPTGANVTDEQFLKKFKINRCDLLFNRRKWREGYYD